MRIQYWLALLLALCFVALSFLPDADTCEHAREMVEIWESDPRAKSERNGWPPETLKDLECW